MVKTKPMPKYVSDDLYVRFIFSAPDQEKQDLIRIMFRLELAHWFYLDNHCLTDFKLPKLTFCNFVDIFIQRYKCLATTKSSKEAINKFKSYKKKVPVYGLAMVSPNMDQVVLVQNFQTKTWTFPKGKINQDESPLKCAIRECFEETGFDASSYVLPKFKLPMGPKNVNQTIIYIAVGVPISTVFKPTTCCEIGDIKWFDIDPSDFSVAYRKTNIVQDRVIFLIKNLKELLPTINFHSTPDHLTFDDSHLTVDYSRLTVDDCTTDEFSHKPLVKVTTLYAQKPDNDNILTSSFGTLPSYNQNNKNNFYGSFSKRRDPNDRKNVGSYNIPDNNETSSSYPIVIKITDVSCIPAVPYHSINPCQIFTGYQKALSSWIFSEPNPFSF